MATVIFNFLFYCKIFSWKPYDALAELHLTSKPFGLLVLNDLKRTYKGVRGKKFFFRTPTLVNQWILMASLAWTKTLFYRVFFRYEYLLVYHESVVENNCIIGGKKTVLRKLVKKRQKKSKRYFDGSIAFFRTSFFGFEWSAQKRWRHGEENSSKQKKKNREFYQMLFTPIVNRRFDRKSSHLLCISSIIF